ncbi:MAG: diacylglycerol kinase family lipid kinase [Pyrinomonadaceae bacterium]
MLPLIIVNPSSANGATGKNWARTASDVREHFGAFQVAFTKAHGDGRDIAFREAKDGRSFVIACGGDGTISEVANGILEAEADAELGILPSGTGGDFRRTLEMPTRISDAAKTLREGRTKRIDVGRVEYLNHEGANATRYFLNVASFGLAGAVIETLKNDSSVPVPFISSIARALGGKVAYAAAAAQSAVTMKRPMVRLYVDDKEATNLTVTNLCIANARFFGGGMKVAPDALLDDGKLDVVSIGDLSALEIFTNGYKLYLGTHLSMQQVKHTHATRITAHPFNEHEIIKLESDGEIIGCLPATFEILPKALRVRCP